MKKKEGIFIVLFLILIVVILGLVIYISNKNKVENNEIIEEYTPEEEISDEQLRNTIISLYFINKESGEINPEARTININDLIDNPYKYLLEQLIEGPKNEKLEKAIPENTVLNNVELKGDILYIDLSHDFIDNAKEGKENENKILETIVKTVTELNEVNSVKILIDGKEDMAFKDNLIKFDDPFVVIKEDSNRNSENSEMVKTNIINNEVTDNTNMIED